ncbi:uncharacterized protein LOC135370558 [Ornithodoros turicata]|uniref:uncharacterized protein LOC135370558 n=1 Tax=Ornithodoros turicata TaxID=34597 RepID=UPI0031392731
MVIDPSLSNPGHVVIGEPAEMQDVTVCRSETPLENGTVEFEPYVAQECILVNLVNPPVPLFAHPQFENELLGDADISSFSAVHFEQHEPDGSLEMPSSSVLVDSEEMLPGCSNASDIPPSQERLYCGGKPCEHEFLIADLKRRLNVSQKRVRQLEQKLGALEKDPRTCLAPDQLRSMENSDARANRWDDATILKALKTRLACGRGGYEFVKDRLFATTVRKNLAKKDRKCEIWTRYSRGAAASTQSKAGANAQ